LSSGGKKTFWKSQQKGIIFLISWKYLKQEGATGLNTFDAGGIPSGAISIPVRYVHSPVETASMSDINNAVNCWLKPFADIYMYEINRLIKRFIKGFLPLWREAFLVIRFFDYGILT